MAGSSALAAGNGNGGGSFAMAGHGSAGSVALAAGTGNMDLLATTDYNERRAIIQKYGYSSQFSTWFIEEPFFHHWTLNGWGNVFRINMDRRKALKDAANKAILQV